MVQINLKTNFVIIKSLFLEYIYLSLIKIERNFKTPTVVLNYKKKKSKFHAICLYDARESEKGRPL